MLQIAKWFQYSLVTALTHAPSVVLLDDLDSLMPVIPEHAPPQEQHQMEFITEIFAEIFDWLRTKVPPWPLSPPYCKLTSSSVEFMR